MADKAFANTDTPASPVRAALAVAWTGLGPDRRLLVTRRPPGKPFAGLWEWPGGKVERGEHPAAAALRELHEETGLHAPATAVSALALHHHPGAPAIDFHVFTVAFEHAVEARMLGCIEARWLPVEQALALDFPPANAAINRLIADWALAAPSERSAPRPSQVR